MTNTGEVCSICGGDGRISNSFGGGGATCPSCHGSGRRSAPTGFHDVTKTKPSHHAQSQRNQKAEPKPQWPTSVGGDLLAREVTASSCSADVKARLIRETMDHEATHAECTQTFIKKVRKQLKG